MSDMVNGDGGYAFVMQFVSASDKYRQQFIEKWQEVISNFIVEGAQVSGGVTGETSPYSRSRVYRSPRNRIYLKDPETHKLVMTFAAKLVRSVIGDREGKYVQCQPVGYEDVPKSQISTRLTRYNFGLPGHFRSLVETVVDMLLIGTCTVESYWKYEEREVVVRDIESDGQTDVSTMTRDTVTTYDDPCFRPLDVLDFYPDPARYRLDDMSGCAKRFKMNGFEAQRMADSGYYKADSVKKAMASAPKTSDDKPSSFRSGLDQPAQAEPIPSFKEMTGYDYWGEVPSTAWVRDDETGKSFTRGRITILNQVVVKSVAWPLVDSKLPFTAFYINPVQGRYYGISPAEVVRFDQSFADAVKILLAEAIVRQVHPPIAYDSDAEFDVSKLREWRADLPIPIRGGPSAIGTLRYDADVSSGFALLAGLKEEIKGGSGALGGIQGENGPDRESATGASQRVQMALERPELAGMILESDCLPSLAQKLFKLGQQFIEDTDELKKRVGELPEPFWIGDILGDFDIRFVGSRNAVSNQEKLQAFDRLVSYATAVPAFQMFLPHTDIGQMIVGEFMGLPEAAAQIGDPAMMQQNLDATMAATQAGATGGTAQNGVPPTPQPTGMMPQQAAGGAQ